MTFAEFTRRLRALILRRRMTADLEEEMRAHIALRANALHSAGTSTDDAQAAATRSFGNRASLQEEGHDAWGFGWVDQAIQDLRHAARRLLQRPGFTLAVVSVMALGIGASTAMFSAVDAAMLRPLPFAAPNELVTLRNLNVPFDPGFQRKGVSLLTLLDFTAIAQMPDVFSHGAAYAAGGLNLSDEQHPLRLKIGVVTSDFFTTLGVSPLRGRAFSAEEGRPNATHVALVSWALWQSQFGARDLAGWTLPFNGKPYTVIGIMPKGFSFPNESQLWIPMSIPTTFETFEPFHGFLPSTVIARVAPGVSVAAAGARLTTAWEQSVAAFKRTPGQRYNVDDALKNIHEKGALTSLQRNLVGDRRTALLVLLGATGLLLLIACANVTNLLLAHAAVRQREMAVREVLGATRGRLIRQLLTESVFLSAAGAILGLGLAPLALRAVRALMPAPLAGVAGTALDLRVLAFATLLALLTGVGFGLWPALGTTRTAPGETIKGGGGHGGTMRGAGRTRRLLVMAELALTLMLLVGAGLMLKSFQRLMGLNTGMDTHRVATLEVAFPTAQSRARRLQMIDDAVDRLAGVSGIEAAGAVNDLPLHGNGGISISVDVPGGPPQKDMSSFVRYLQASSGYFRALGIPILHGRTFTAADDSLAPHVAIVNTAMVKKYWPNVEPLGRIFHMGGDSSTFTVIGVVGNVRETTLDQDPLPQMYFPIAETTPYNVALIARGHPSRHRHAGATLRSRTRRRSLAGRVQPAHDG